MITTQPMARILLANILFLKKEKGHRRMSHRTITCFQHLKENGKGE
jgi:hypothetical protein